MPAPNVRDMHTTPVAVQGTLDDLGTPLSEVTFVVLDLETIAKHAPVAELGAEAEALDKDEVDQAIGDLKTRIRTAGDEIAACLGTPMTKDAVAGRIRRLLAMADKKATAEGIPGTEASLTSDMLDG